MSGDETEQATSPELRPVVGRVNQTETESYTISPPGTSKFRVLVVGVLTIIVMIGLLYFLIQDIVQLPGS
jgi:hypothetical protein